MGVRTTLTGNGQGANASYVGRSTSGSTPLTLGGWIRLDVDNNRQASILFLGNGTTWSQVHWWNVNTDGTSMGVSNASADQVTGPSLVVGSWYYFGLSAAANGAATLYWLLEGEDTFTTDTGGSLGITGNSLLRFGQDSLNNWVSSFPGSFSMMRLWRAVLTQAELLEESASATAVRTTNLEGDWSFEDGSLNDVSGNGNHLTSSGNVSATDDPDLGGGGAIVSGVGTCDFGFTVNANGVGRTLGVGNCAFGFTASGSGVPRVNGLASVVFGFTAASTGVPRVQGSGLASFAFALTASGIKGPVQGVATAALGFTTSATGNPRVLGLGECQFGFSAGAVGDVRRIGVATLAFGFSTTAVGTGRTLGTASLAFAFSAHANGHPRALGQSSIPLGFVASATALRRVRGISTPIYQFEANAIGFAGTPPVTGQGACVFGFSANAVGNRRSVGNASLHFNLEIEGSGKPRILGVAIVALGFTLNAEGDVNHIGRGVGTVDLQFSASAQGARRVYAESLVALLFIATGHGAVELPVVLTGTTGSISKKEMVTSHLRNRVVQGTHSTRPMISSRRVRVI